MTDLAPLVALLASLDAADYLREIANDSEHIAAPAQNPVSPDLGKAA